MVNAAIKRFIAALAATALLIAASCSKDGSENKPDGSMDGTWQKEDWELVISGSSYSLKMSGEEVSNGTVSYDGSTFEFAIKNEVDWQTGEMKKNENGQKIFGQYQLEGDSTVFSHVSQEIFNGTWVKIE